MSLIKKSKFRKMCLFIALVPFLSGVTCPDAYSEIAPAQESPVIAASAVKQPLPSSGNVTVNFKDVDINTVLQYLSEVSGIDIVPSPEVTGTVTMRLRDKPWQVALDVVTRNRGYVYSRDDEQGIIRVLPKSKLEDEAPVSEVIYLNYIQPPSGETFKLVTGEGQQAPLPREQDIEKNPLLMAVNKILVGNEKAMYIPSSNALIVTAIPSRIGEVKKLVAKLDKRTPQIMLETKVIEIILDKNDQFGIDWNMVVSAAGARRPTTFPFTNTGLLESLPGGQRKFFPTQSSGNFNDTAFPQLNAATFFDPSAAATAGAMFAYGTLDFSQFTAVLRMIDNRDDSKIISSPRVTTLNNQPAVIKVTNNVYLQKQVKTTDTATLVTVEFEEEPRETGVILQVIPHVNENGEITVDLKPEVSTVPQFEELQVNGVQNTIAMTFNSREADTRVMVKDGETIFIGGLISEDIQQEDHKVPVLGDLFGWMPLVGSTVKYKQDNIVKREIVFFVTVHLVGEGKDTIVKSGSRQVYGEYYQTGSDEKADKNEPVLKAGVVKSTQTRVDVPVEAVPVEKKKKAFWDFTKKD